MTSQSIQIGDAHVYLEKVLAILHTMGGREKSAIVDVLECISTFVHSACSEISSLRRIDGKDGAFNSAAEEMDEIFSETTQAANTIMAAAEDIERLAIDLPRNGPEILDSVTQIYQACSFHDITGQRITKIARTLKQIEEKIELLISAGGEPMNWSPESADGTASPMDDLALLNGPQLGSRVISQEAIDDLFNS